MLLGNKRCHNHFDMFMTVKRSFVTTMIHKAHCVAQILSKIQLNDGNINANNRLDFQYLILIFVDLRK